MREAKLSQGSRDGSPARRLRKDLGHGKDSDSFECDEDDPDREAKEAEFREKRKAKFTEQARKIAKELETDDSEEEMAPLTEEEFTKILSKVEEMDFATPEEAQKWFED